MNNSDKALNAYNEALKGINVKENERIVLESKTAWCFYFAKNIPKADTKAHEKLF